MPIVNLALADHDDGQSFDPPQYIWVNADHITHWGEEGSCSRIYFANGLELLVMLPADELAEAVDPDGQCGTATDETCLYSLYLGRRPTDDGGDMTHTGFHAADHEAKRHARGCEKAPCVVCAFHERQLRA